MLKTGYEDFPEYNAILGIDEVGYGCGAGDLYVTGVILPKNYSNSELKDSKKLSEKKREKIYSDLMSTEGLIKYTSIIAVEYINANGIAHAMKTAFQDVIVTMYDKFEFDCVFIDGIDTRGIHCEANTITVVKGDNTYQNIAAASIIAKVERDRYMSNLDKTFPNYDLAKNKGYLTPKHLSGLKEFGKTIIHRDQYVRNHT